MKFRIKIYSLLMAVAMMTSFTACSGDAQGKTEVSKDIVTSVSENNTKEETIEIQDSQEISSGMHTVTDHAGNTVEVPDKIERIVIDQIPILSTYMSYFQGDTPYLTGFCGSFKDVISKTVLKDISPELMESSDTVYAQSDLNIEEIIKLNPDVIFYNANNTQHAEILKSSGIPAVGFATLNPDSPADPLERYGQWLRLLEDVFGEEGKMEDFLADGERIVNEIKEKINTVPEADRPTAMILYNCTDGVPQVAGKGIFGEYWLKNLGVKNVALEDCDTAMAQVSMEQIYGWDPEIIFVNGPGLTSVRSGDIIENKVEGVDFSTVSAVKNKRVYGTTLGMWNWFTPNPDAPIVYAWLACNTYPDVFSDYPLEQTIKDYYSKWYGYEISDKDTEEMLVY